ncbi:hypothetical protein N7501_000437 [Penicillium viridicatum]|nr:hypothetical protein N7501_000437 [Penicillium viridicatum]
MCTHVDLHTSKRLEIAAKLHVLEGLFDKMPGQDNQYILAGLTGHGMPQIFLAAEWVAKMIMDRVKYEETELPRLFKTTQARLDNSKSKILEKTPDPGSSEVKI